jgi:hypothetical protein
MLKTATPYRDSGPQHFDSRHNQAQITKLLTRLRNLGVVAHFDTLKRPDQAAVSC